MNQNVYRRKGFEMFTVFNVTIVLLVVIVQPVVHIYHTLQCIRDGNNRIAC